MTDLLNSIPRVDPTSKPTMMRGAVARILATTTGSAVHHMFVAPLDTRLMHLTGGRVHLAKGTIPLVLLRTSGARSGVEREVPLSYFTDGDDVIRGWAATGMRDVAGAAAERLAADERFGRGRHH